MTIRTRDDYEHTLQALGICVSNRIPVLLWGNPGEGKTAVVESARAGGLARRDPDRQPLRAQRLRRAPGGRARRLGGPGAARLGHPAGRGRRAVDRVLRRVLDRVAGTAGRGTPSAHPLRGGVPEAPGDGLVRRRRQPGGRRRGGVGAGRADRVAVRPPRLGAAGGGVRRVPRDRRLAGHAGRRRGPRPGRRGPARARPRRRLPADPGHPAERHPAGRGSAGPGLPDPAHLGLRRPAVGVRPGHRCAQGGPAAARHRLSGRGGRARVPRVDRRPGPPRPRAAAGRRRRASTPRGCGPTAPTCCCRPCSGRSSRERSAERWTNAVRLCAKVGAAIGIDAAVPVVRALLRGGVRPSGAAVPSEITVFAPALALAGLLPEPS